MFKIAKQRERCLKSKYVRDEIGTPKVKENKVMERWRSYFSSLLNKTIEYQLEEKDKVEGPIWGVTEQMVEQALTSMKVGKALGPSGVTSKLIMAAGTTGVKWLFQVSESIEHSPLWLLFTPNSKLLLLKHSFFK